MMRENIKNVENTITIRRVASEEREISLEEFFGDEKHK